MRLGNIGPFFYKRVLCSLLFPKKGPMFPDMYVTGEHRTLFFKKGSMFPGLLLFPPLLPNSGRDNYHCMSLPFVEEGETSENLTQSIHTPVNKPEKPNPYESSPRYGHPEAHRAFGRDIIIQLYYIIYYII